MKLGLFLVSLLFACGPSVRTLPGSEVAPSGFQHCFAAYVNYDKKINKVYACFPTRKMCKHAVRGAKGTLGKLIRIESVTQCQTILH